jgi:hypothetical protein
MVFSITFKNISVISWRSVLLVEETGEDQNVLHNVVSSRPRMIVIRTHNVSVYKHLLHRYI